MTKSKHLSRMVSVPSIPVTIDETNIPKGALDILQVVRPKWTCPSRIQSKVFTDGLSNKLVGFFIEENPEDVVIVKVFGENTGEMIDREAEVETMRILHEQKCGAELYLTFNNGICYEYMNGSTLEVVHCSDPEIFPLVASEMARMHSTVNNKHHQNHQNPISINGTTPLNPNNSRVPSNIPKSRCPLWPKLHQFNKLAEECLSLDNSLRERLEMVGVKGGWASAEIEDLRKILERKEMPITFCHNDLIPRNIVYDQKRRRITFIDVEYAMNNYPAFDVANHFLEFAGVPDLDYTKCPDKSFRLKWISEYLKNLRLHDYKGKISVEEFNEWVELCTPASHLFWGLWAIHQARHSTIEFDYVKYVGIRFAEYKKCMDSLRQKN